MSDPSHCTVDGCTSPVHSRMLCRVHYGRWWRRGTFEPARQQRIREEGEDVSRSNQLEEARRLYGLVSTLEARLYWRGRIRELEAQEKKLAPA